MAHDDALRGVGKCGFIRPDGRACKAPAGRGTEHKGEGCCRSHGGNGGRPATNGAHLGEGKYRRYDVIKAPRLRELSEHFEHDPDPLDLLPEVILLRSLITDFAERHAEATEALIAWHASFSREYRSAVDAAEEKGEPAPDPADHVTKPRTVIDILQVGRFLVEIGSLSDKIQKQRIQGAVSLLEVNTFWQQLGFEMVRGVREVVKDEIAAAELIGAIQRRWDAIHPPSAGGSRTA